MEKNNANEMDLFIESLGTNLFEFLKKIDSKTFKRLTFSFEKLELENEIYIEYLEKFEKLKSNVISYKSDLLIEKQNVSLYIDRKNTTIGNINRELSSIFCEFSKKNPIMESLGLVTLFFKDEDFSLNSFLNLKNGKISVTDYFEYISCLMANKAREIVQKSKEESKLYNDIMEIFLIKKQLHQEKEKYMKLINLKENLIVLLESESIKKLFEKISKTNELLNEQKSRALVAYKNLMLSSANLRTFNEDLIVGNYSIKTDHDVESLKKQYDRLDNKNKDNDYEYHEQEKIKKSIEEDVIKYYIEFLDVIFLQYPEFKSNSIFKGKNGQDFSLTEFIHSELGDYDCMNYKKIIDKIINSIFCQINSEIDLTTKNIEKNEAQIYQKMTCLNDKFKDNSNLLLLYQFLFSDDDISIQDFSKVLKLKIKNDICT